LSKIAFVDLVFNFPPNGGASTDIYNIMKRTMQNHDVKLFLPKHKKIKISPDFDIPFEMIESPNFGFNYKKYPQQLKKAIDIYNPDHLFIADGWYLKPYLVNHLKNFKPILRFYAYETLCLKSHGHFARLGKLCMNNYLENKWADLVECKLCSLLWIISNHNRVFLQEYLNSKAYNPKYSNVVKKALVNSERIIVYNRLTQDRILPYNENVDIVPSGVNTEIFGPSQTDKKNDKIVILAFGRLDQWYKGLDLLVQSCKKLWQERTDFILKVTTTKKFNLPFIESLGWVNHDELPNLIIDADICIFPSLWEEPFGISVLEAMSCGKPVIVSNAGALPEIVHDKETGLIFKRERFEDLKENIINLLDDKALRLQLGQNARKFVTEKYSWEIIYHDYYRLLFV
jgi:glycosyltransferase involved in cell wall biosynthesis